MKSFPKIFSIIFAISLGLAVGITFNYVLIAFTEPGQNPPGGGVTGIFAPIFYDSDDSDNYYINPNGQTNLQNLNVSGTHNIQDADNYVSNAGYAGSAGSVGPFSSNGTANGNVYYCYQNRNGGGNEYVIAPWSSSSAACLNWCRTVTGNQYEFGTINTTAGNRNIIAGGSC